jgi:hypothetical protein
MKNLINSMFTLVVLSMLVFSACSDEATNNAPEFESVAISSDNKTITITFTEEVYANNDKTGNLMKEDFDLEILNVDFSFEVTHTAGSKTATVSLLITSVTDGTEIIKVAPANDASIYDAEGMPMKADHQILSDPIAKDQGIIGKWYSSGDNVAPLLVASFNVDSIYASFKDDGTYIVEQYNVGNTSSTPDFIFSGTYTIEKSNVGEIWNIEIAQQEFYAANASGIFEIKANPEVLWYEVVQTSGTQNVPPTPTDGFGSSNGGTLGVSNVQKFIRITN